MAPTRKQPRSMKKEIQNYCAALKKKLENNSKLVEEFLKLIDSLEPETPELVTINFADIDFGNIDCNALLPGG